MPASTSWSQTTNDVSDTQEITLQKILQVGFGGGGGSSGAIKSGIIDPVAAPTTTTIDNWYINTAVDPNTGWFWKANGVAWKQQY